jgi:hypothetical protein
MATPIYLSRDPDEAVVKLNYEKAVEALGKICVEFQLLETHLKVAIGNLLDSDDYRPGVIVTAKLSFQATLDLFGALYQHRFNDAVEHKELDRFLNKCKKVEERRNQILHSHWRPDTIGGKGAIRTKFTARRTFKTQQQLLSQAGLQKEADDLQALRETFLKVWAARVVRNVTPRKRIY